jgi:hypothetical protein
MVHSELAFVVLTDMAVLKELFVSDTVFNKYKEYNFDVIVWQPVQKFRGFECNSKRNYCHHYIPLSILKQSEN